MKTPDPLFERSFTLEYSHAPELDGSYDVEDGDTWAITFRNLDKIPSISLCSALILPGRSATSWMRRTDVTPSPYCR